MANVIFTQIGTITNLASLNDGQRQATIRILPASSCAKCAAGNGCGAGLFSQLLRAKKVDIKVPVNVGLSVGQRVWLCLDDQYINKQAWYWYGLPVLGFILGASLPRWVFITVENSTADILSLMAGLTVMLFCWLVARRIQPVVHPKILTQAPCVASNHANDGVY